ncbi:MAG: DUF1287 domain-containing protein [Firmicutes bacterium]|nr:DUF1287 domain-containing protein [Bacillota bacterium]
MKILIGIAVAIAIAELIFLAYYFNIIPQKAYEEADFESEEATLGMDFNKNGTDDYTDFLFGARIDAENRPTYDDSYFATGYPPDDIGVCTDVVWRAFRHAGYNLREMVDNDIEARPEAYTTIERRDDNIDFRRVRNLKVFFEEYAIPLTTDIEQTDQWLHGDIVIFEGERHIGIISDKRNSQGIPYVIHNSGQLRREEDYFKREKPTAHFRFDAALLDPGLLIKWEDGKTYIPEDMAEALSAMPSDTQKVSEG